MIPDRIIAEVIEIKYHVGNLRADGLVFMTTVINLRVT
jgi:hypothetical protein